VYKKGLGLIMRGYIITIISLFFLTSFGKDAFFTFLAVVLLSWLACILTWKLRETHRKLSFLAGILGIIGIFIIFILRKTGTGLHTIGLSYYFLMLAGLIIKVIRDGSKPVIDPVKFVGCAAFFPLLIEGPICDLTELSERLFDSREVGFKEAFFPAVARFTFGLFKKLVIADRLAGVTIALTGSFDFASPAFYLGVFLYSIRLIADFTGGIDMAISLALLCGVRVPENFAFPLFAASLADYWKRWHITLSDWAKTNIFYPLSVALSNSTAFEKISTKTAVRLSVYVSAIMTWVFTGLWHGISIWYLLWGLSNAAILLFSYEMRGKVAKFRESHAFTKTKAYFFFQCIRTFILTGALRIFDLLAYRNGSTLQTSATITHKEMFVIFLAVSFALLVSFISKKKGKRGTSFYALIEEKKPAVRLAAILVLLGVTIIFGAYGTGFEISGFIYGKVAV